MTDTKPDPTRAARLRAWRRRQKLRKQVTADAIREDESSPEVSQ